MNQSGSRVKLVNEETVPFKKPEFTVNSGHKQTKHRYRRRRKNNRGDGDKSTKDLNSNKQPNDKFIEQICDNSNNMKSDQNTEILSEQKGMQSDLVESEKAFKSFENEKSIKTDRSLTIGKLGISSLLKLDLILMNTTVKAAVDTAAEVSIISDKLYNKLIPKPPILRQATVNTAGRGMEIDTFIVGPVNIEIGSKFYKTELYVAPIYS